MAAAELDEHAGRQFDPEVVQAFHRVPREEWDELRRRSLIVQRQQKAATQHADAKAVGALIESRLATLIH